MKTLCVYSRGFAALPTELLHHVASQIPETTVPWYCQWTRHDGQHNERRDALRALSQLCCSLRVAFLPLVWERLEVFVQLYRGEDDPCTLRAQFEAAGRQFRRQLRLIRKVKQPYALYVRCRLFLSCSRSAVHHSRLIQSYHCGILPRVIRLDEVDTRHDAHAKSTYGSIHNQVV
jgi:hypothetical protein